jgi:maleylpyruvate isomerase
MDARELDACVSGCALAHQRLLADLDTRLAQGALDTSAPSSLPDWAVAHVLAHVVGNAHGFTRLIDAAMRGEVGVMYPGGREGRAAQIDALATQDADSLVSEVRRSIWALETAWAACPAEGWQAVGESFAGPIHLIDIPLRRWREVEVHRGDLGWGYDPSSWDPAYVERDLPTFTAMWLQRHGTPDAGLPEAVLAMQPAQRLAWLLGRYQPPDVPSGLRL